MKYANQERLNTELQIRMKEAELKVVEGEALWKKLHDTILELKGNIRVFCRVRPPLSGECVDNETKTISFPTTTATRGRGVEIVHNGRCHLFMFDKVFMPQASQGEVFVEISQLVQSAFDGYKVCIFAYGQTGSGKTHTMMGTLESHEEKGLIPRSLEQIFASQEKLLEQGWKFQLQVSMLEIYNESIHDLLSTKKGKDHVIRLDADNNPCVSNLTIMDAQSSDEVSSLLNQAAQNRSVGKTRMNEKSSRSHFVITLRISGAMEGTDKHVQGVLNLIDLAGSERLSKSGATKGGQQKETVVCIINLLEARF